MRTPSDLTRRSWLRFATAGAAAAATVLRAPRVSLDGLASAEQAHESDVAMRHAGHAMGPVGRVTSAALNPTVFLRSWNFSDLAPDKRAEYYRETTRPDGSSLREYHLVAIDREIEIAPGVFFPAWTFNGQVPGPTLRATEGDRVRVTFINEGSHPHSIHFHGWHPPEMDGSLPEQQVPPGGQFVYEFDAEPFGLHLYHCHALPLKRHIHKGLYGAFIVDPRETRPPADELVMVMNGFDTNFDADNEVYAVNSIANHYMNEPITVEVGALIRVYLVNVTEFDLLNSFHLHGMFFNVNRTGTSRAAAETTDTVMLCQGERAILETRFRYPGRFMFHAHQSEFAELGWMGMFEATGGRRDT
jgi:FtsP/CotA-like multicopper oxidase with cupredoxin domain